MSRPLPAPSDRRAPGGSPAVPAGGAGTWFTFGYFTYITVGVIGVAISSLFYHYLQESGAAGRGGRGGRAAGARAWTHLALMSAGAAAASAMMMLAGYQGGAAVLPAAAGGMGLDAAQAHTIIAPYVEPIAASILALLAGVAAGGQGLCLRMAARERQKRLQMSAIWAAAAAPPARGKGRSRSCLVSCGNNI